MQKYLLSGLLLAAGLAYAGAASAQIARQAIIARIVIPPLRLSEALLDAARTLPETDGDSKGSPAKGLRHRSSLSRRGNPSNLIRIVPA